MDCRTASRLLSEAQDRKLPRLRRLSLGFHVLYCRACHNFGRQLSVLRQASQFFVKDGKRDHHHREP